MTTDRSRHLVARPVHTRIALFLLSLLGLFSLLPGAEARSTRQEFFNERVKQEIREMTPREDRAYLVDIGSRVIRPDLRTPIEFTGARAVVYLQFDEPLGATERTRLIQSGVRFYGAVAKSTYLARVPQEVMSELRELVSLRGIEPVAYADRMSARLFAGDVRATTFNADRTWSVHVQVYDDVSLGHVLYKLDELGIAPTDASRLLFNHRVRVQASWEQIYELAQSHIVRSIREVPVARRADNDTAQSLSNVHLVHDAPWNLDGSGVVVGLWDEGPVREDHPDLIGRVTNVETANPIGDHSTHVAGTIIGSGTGDASAEGMAPGVPQLFSCDFDGDPATEMADAVSLNGIVIANNSWSSLLGWDQSTGSWVDAGNSELFGAYDATARDWDALVRQTGLIIVKSAGNDADDYDPSTTGQDGITGSDGHQYQTIGSHGNAKNIITVGAVDEAGVIADFSSAGPTADGRIKPDVVANGVNLSSAWNAGDAMGHTGCIGLDYCAIEGTSTACAAVSGITALLVEHYRVVYGGLDPSPDLIRALLVNTAQDLGRPGPDYLYGHGLVDALAAIETIDNGTSRMLTDAVGDGILHRYSIEVLADLEELRVAIAWTDPEAAAGASSTLINDIDLMLTDPAGNLHYAFSGPAADFTDLATTSGPNTLDTVENVRVASPMQGTWTATVYGTAIASGPQVFSVVSNSTTNVIGPIAGLSMIPNSIDFSNTCPDGSFQDITVTVTNLSGSSFVFLGPIALANTIPGAEANFSLLGDPTFPPIVLPNGASFPVTVRFSPLSAGNKAGTIAFSVQPLGGQVTTFGPFPITGAGGAPELYASLEHLGFGNVRIGEFETLEVNVFNNGDCDLVITNYAKTSGSSEHSACPSTTSPISCTTTPAFPIVLPPGEDYIFTHEFRPTALTSGPNAATYTLSTSDPLVGFVLQVGGESPPPIISVSEAYSDDAFANVCVGETAEKVFQICNVGFNDLNVTDVRFNGAGCGVYALVDPSDTAVVNLPAGACLPVLVRFTPNAAGQAFTCNVEVDSNDPNTPTAIVNVDGTSGAPALQVSVPLALPQTLIGQSSVVELQVINSGTCPLTIIDYARTAGSPEITACPSTTNPGCHLPPLPWIVAAGETLLIPHTYAPTAYGTAMATFTLQTDTALNPITVPIIGTSPAPQIALSGSTRFENVCVNDFDESAVEICNTGFNNLDVTDVSISGADAAQFALINSPFPPAAGAPNPQPVSKDFCLPVTVRYQPLVSSPPVAGHAASLDVTFATDTLMPPTTATVSLPLSGFSGLADLETTLEASGNFGNILVGDSRTLTYQVINDGVCDMEVLGLARIAGSDRFTLGEQVPGQTFPIIVQPGEHVNFPFTLTPHTYQDFNSTWQLTWRTDRLPGTQATRNFMLTGESLPPILSLTGSTRFENVCVGDYAENIVDVCNTGFNDLRVTDVSISGADAANFSLINSPFPPAVAVAFVAVSKDFCLPVTVRYTPLAPGNHVASLDITYQTALSPVVTTATVSLVLTGSSGLADLETTLEANGMFGNVKVGDFRTLEYQIINDGICPMEIVSLQRIAGSNTFTIGEQVPGGTFPIIVLPGEHVNIAFRFRPDDFIMFMSTWRLTWRTQNVPATQATRDFMLQGRSLPPIFQLTGNLDFGDVCGPPDPNFPPELTVDICNTGFNDMCVTDVRLVDDGGGECEDFELVNSPFPPDMPTDPSNACDGTDISKDFCMPLTIRFTPEGVGEKECTLRITYIGINMTQPGMRPITVDFEVEGVLREVIVDVPDDIGFPPTVIQSVDPMCVSEEPFNITNLGKCNVTITEIEIEGDDAGDFEFENLPELPLVVQAGNRVGNGHLKVLFKPTEVERFREARVKITWIDHDPEIGDERTEYVKLCGEGVKTGGRILVTQGGNPVQRVDKILLWRIDNPGPNEIAFNIEAVGHRVLKEVEEDDPCPGFLFHHEWGGETNPILLQPGFYRVEVALQAGAGMNREVEFEIPTVCDFIDDIVLDFPRF